MKIIMILLSFLSLGIGIVGVVLPILPTTPFFLLTLFLLSKSSEKYHNWITSLGIYKKHVQSFHENRTMTFRQKWVLLITVDIMLLLSFIQVNALPLRILIIILFLYKHYYFKKNITVIRNQAV